MDFNDKKKEATEYTKNIHKIIKEKLNSKYEKEEDEDIKEVRRHLIYSIGDIVNTGEYKQFGLIV